MRSRSEGSSGQKGREKRSGKSSLKTCRIARILVRGAKSEGKDELGSEEVRGGKPKASSAKPGGRGEPERSLRGGQKGRQKPYEKKKVWWNTKGEDASQRGEKLRKPLGRKGEGPLFRGEGEKEHGSVRGGGGKRSGPGGKAAKNSKT